MITRFFPWKGTLVLAKSDIIIGPAIAPGGSTVCLCDLAGPPFILREGTGTLQYTASTMTAA